MGLNIFKKLKKSRTTSPTSSSGAHLEADSKSIIVDNSDDENFMLTPQATESTISDDHHVEDEYSYAAEIVNFIEPTITSKKHNYNGATSRDGVPVISSDYGDHFRPSDVGSQQSSTGFKESRAHTVPNLRDSAYSGLPRYDWIDVESAAATKLQSMYRRNSVIKKLERDGKLTASMRNNMRSRKSCKTNKVSEDVPALFRFCGIGFLFNEALGGDSDALNEKKISTSEDKRQLRLAQDEMNRKFRMRNKPGETIVEAVEVVDD